MKAKITPALIATTLAIAIGLAEQPAAAKELLFFDFEKSLAPFESVLDSAFKDGSFELRYQQEGYPDVIPNRYANLKFTPSSATSTMWMGAGFEADGEEMVRLEFYAKDTGDCASCRPVVYVGTEKATEGAQFKVAEAVKEPNPDFIEGTLLTEQWTLYKYSTVVKASGTVYVAVGWQAANPTGHMPVTGSVGIDSLGLTIFPAP